MTCPRQSHITPTNCPNLRQQAVSRLPSRNTARLAPSPPRRASLAVTLPAGFCGSPRAGRIQGARQLVTSHLSCYLSSVTRVTFMKGKGGVLPATPRPAHPPLCLSGTGINAERTHVWLQAEIIVHLPGRSLTHVPGAGHPRVHGK